MYMYMYMYVCMYVCIYIYIYICRKEGTGPGSNICMRNLLGWLRLGRLKIT